MDCCNYMQYRQPYYGSQYYDSVQYPGEYYGQQYQEFYGSYGMQPWPCTAPFPDYVYNPKEARIRKAMREATRERALGVTAMASTRAGRRNQPWSLNEEESPLMMNPAHGIRGVIGSPMCGTSGFPIPTPGNGQFMQPMPNYSKHMHIAPNSSIHESNSYLQPSPIAQLQHQTEMWHHYQETMRSNQTDATYMMHSDIQQQYQQPHQHHASEMVSNSHPTPPAKSKITPESFPCRDDVPQTHTNENTPPKGAQEKLPMTEPHFDSKMDHVQPLIETGNLQQSEPFIPLYQENSVESNSNFEKGMDMKMKKLPTRTNTKLNSKPLPDFNEAFGSTERGRFQSPPDPRLGPNKGYLDYFFPNSGMKFEDYHI